jgi:hypothetical protein
MSNETLTTPNVLAQSLIAPVDQPRFKAEIATSTKGFHSFTIKVSGDILDDVIEEVKAASDKLGTYCNGKNEGL